MKKRFLLLPILVFLAGCFWAAGVYRMPAGWDNDIILLNRIAQESARCWEDLQKGEFPDYGGSFSVLGLDGTVRYRSGEDAPVSVMEAVSMGNPVLDVEKEGGIIGKVLVSRNPGELLLAYRNRAALGVLAAAAIFALCTGGCLAFLNHTILRPFRKLEHFAAEVAGGNLDFALERNKNNMFGAFTESFDLMREQLKEAREKEYLANRNQKELVASLSHDIKTPVTSIRVSAELLLELEKEERLKEKLRMIYRKTEQIEELVTNLFSTTLQDMEQLTVTPEAVYSRELERLIRSADPREKVRAEGIPDCMLYLDEIRFTQVLSNIISNACKYGESDIRVDTSLIDSHLKLYIRNSGNPVSEEELPLLMNKFYRGKNAEKVSGSGLGLYICKKLMEQMQGEIYCTCSGNEFTVVLMIKLI